MSEHRVRLTDEDVELIVSGLSARAAMTKGLRRHRIRRLKDRLLELAPGNPKWRIDDFGQTHEDELDAQELAEEG